MKKILLSAIFAMAMAGLSIGQTTNLPTIDGDGSEGAWDTAAFWDITAVIEDANIADAADFSGQLKVLWSTDSLYVLVEVTDDTLYGGTGAAYIYDNVVVYIDAFNKATPSYVDSTQVFFEKNWWQEATQMGGRTGTQWATPPGNFAVNIVNETGYTIELAYAWSDAQKTPAVGDVVGFDVKLSDNDGGEGEPRDQLAWRDITDTGWDKPYVWGEIMLNANGSVTGQTDFEVSVDGDATDRAWAIVPPVNIGSIISVDGVENDADFSGTWKAIWTTDTLFVLVEERDDTLVGEMAGNEYIYDNVVVYVDAENKKSNDYTDSSIFNYEKNWWQPDTNMKGRTGQDWVTPPSNYATGIDTGSMYTLEIAIPFNRLSLTLAEGDTLGFDVKLSDNDGDDVRDQLAWYDISDNGWQSAAVFGEIVLLENGFVDAISMRPSKPSGLKAEVTVDTVVTLTWKNDTSMIGWDVYLGNKMLGHTVDTFYVHHNTVSDTHTYGVRGMDADSVVSNKATVEVIINLDDNGGVGIITQSNSLNEVKVYPNPVNELLTISSELNISNVSIYDITGRKILIQESINSTKIQIDVRSLAQGIYIIQINDHRGGSSSQKVRVY